MMQLIKQLAAHIDASERDSYVIFGSIAITLHGIALGRDIDDLDVFVSEGTFAGLKSRFDEQSKPGRDGPVPFFSPEEKIEILMSFPGVRFDKVHENACLQKESEGFLVGAIDDLITWKEAQDRDKDLKDLKIIQEHLSSLSGPQE